MCKKMTIIVLSILLAITSIVMIVFIGLYYSEKSYQREWIVKLPSEWNIKLEDDSNQPELIGMMRRHLLHAIMMFKKKSTLVSYDNDLLI